ncbi:MAG: bile acid:sodium symporter [Deltaproteobacteria bacterium]|nr:bile acid:sodium symporter [Deltaproteobacteria bacterium]MBW1959071.1 bile acid:sodium symporter [Deltaproteobacteria bacterium]MBW2014134.1 bile acid:sodium symporter [Deltaproteobacteria bacterium]MBW2089554.1 bile acid:sodium symporter [Deltaproteobacteria bacterium]MBW2320414.1 bile acid:sodium symporter [Deltaproteobacteria bacterium]
MYDLIKKYWFIAGLVFVFTITVADTTGTVSGIGRWLKMHRGPDAVIVLIFFFSGLILNARQIRSGLMDIKGISIALVIIFLVSPITGALFGMASLETGIKIGIFLVAVMPTTLSSGVVMTGAAGGNMAHALVITILANGLAVFTIPVALSLLLNLVGGNAVVSIDKAAIVMKLGCYVLLPLFTGLMIKFYTKSLINRFVMKLQVLNQCLVLGIVWMAMSSARGAIIGTGGSVGIIFLLVFGFHGILLSSSGLFSKILKLGRGRKESVIFMGSQKTLPLSVILQVSLFPQYGMALVVCVLHHLVHLLMDGYLVGRLRKIED